MTASAALAFGFLLVRATSLFMVAPIFGAKAVPVRVRLGLAVVVAASAFALVAHGAAVRSLDATSLFGSLASELALGLVAGTVPRVFIDAANAAGQTLGLSAGLGFGATIDPVHGASSTAVGELTSLVALGAAVALGLHREVVAWFCASAEQIPPGTAVDLWGFTDAAVTASLSSVALAVRLAFPVMAATTCVHLVLGIVGRAVPQMSLSNVGFAVPLLAGGWALSTCANDMAAIAARAALDALHRLS